MADIVSLRWDNVNWSIGDIFKVELALDGDGGDRVWKMPGKSRL